MGHPRIAPSVVLRGRRALGKGETQLDSLIVDMNRGYMWGLGGLTCVMLSGCYLARCKFTRVSAKPSDMGDTCCSHSIEVPFHLCSYEIYVYV
jgi:hypothetical protein